MRPEEEVNNVSNSREAEGGGEGAGCAQRQDGQTASRVKRLQEREEQEVLELWTGRRRGRRTEESRRDEWEQGRGRSKQ